MPLLSEMFCCEREETTEQDPVKDDDAINLSHVGKAAYECLRQKHAHLWHECWNVTSGRVVGEVHQTPWLKNYAPQATWAMADDLPDNHADWLPEKIKEIMSRAQYWVDVTSLGPPDGLFMERMSEALYQINKTAMMKPDDEPIVVRMLFGNIIGMPVNCTAVIKELTKHLDEDNCNIELWVGAWRKGVSWNHAKIIAVDGRYLHTGGHNLWDQHYLKHDPVHDLSMEATGRVAHDGHKFANKMWEFIEKQQSTFIGRIVDKLPDNAPTILQSRVTVSEFPEGIDEFPPYYEKKCIPFDPRFEDDRRGHVPMIPMGRYGSLSYRARPSDDAIEAMFKEAKTVIRCALQDLGPICLPGTKIPVPGLIWPKTFLKAFGEVIYKRGVDVEIVLSNPGSIPGSLGPTEALYGNGWTCADVASEIIKAIIELDEDIEDHELRKLVEENLRLCYLKQGQKHTWGTGTTKGMHAKHFIIDDTAYYIGSQNLYVSDLAEWGILIDDPGQTAKAMQEYWNPMWANSYQEGVDCDVDEVMDGLDISRDGESLTFASHGTRQNAAKALAGNSGKSDYYR